MCRQLYSREDTFLFFRETAGAVPQSYQGSCPPQPKLIRFWVVIGPFISLPFQRKYETNRHLLCLYLGAIRRSQKGSALLEVLPSPSVHLAQQEIGKRLDSNQHSKIQYCSTAAATGLQMDIFTDHKASFLVAKVCNTLYKA